MTDLIKNKSVNRYRFHMMNGDVIEEYVLDFLEDIDKRTDVFSVFEDAISKKAHDTFHTLEGRTDDVDWIGFPWSKVCWVEVLEDCNERTNME